MDTDANNNKDAKSITLINMLDNFFSDIYIIYLFILRFFKEAFIPPYNFKEITKQCYNIGYKSLPIITLTGLSSVLCLQNNQGHPWQILAQHHGCHL